MNLRRSVKGSRRMKHQYTHRVIEDEAVSRARGYRMTDAEAAEEVVILRRRASRPEWVRAWVDDDQTIWSVALMWGLLAFIGPVWVFGGPVYIGVWGAPGWNWQNALLVGPWAAMGIATIIGGVGCLVWYLGVLAWHFCRGGWKSLSE